MRLFFALWPDALVQAALARQAQTLASAIGGRATRAEAIHLTLAFLGDVDALDLPKVRQTAQGVAADAFELELDRLGCWKHNAIGWLAPGTAPAALSALVENLRGELRTAGIAFDRKSFRPHVTLVRKAVRECAERSIEPIVWPLLEFALMRSDLTAAGARYECVDRWALRVAQLTSNPSRESR